MKAEGHPITRVCDVLGLSKSSYDYKVVKANEAEVEAAIGTIAGRFPTYGTQRIAHQIRRSPYKLTVSRKRVRRVMAQKGLLRLVERKKRRTTNSEHPCPRYPNLVKGLEIVRPDQVWVSDITYIRLLEDFVCLAIIMDVFTRGLRWCSSSDWAFHRRDLHDQTDPFIAGVFDPG